ncbi:MAG: hypothetical protein GY856_11585 [bacterium]|nr:hypothetical protein [bacterium]
MNQRLDSKLKKWLVEQAEPIADKASRKTGQTAQLRNLLQIAQVESEVLVLKNFLEYQAGRQSTRAFWGPIHQEVIRVLEEIAERIVAEDQRQLAIRSFFGYMVRRYVYQTEVAKSGGKNHGHPSQWRK